MRDLPDQRIGAIYIGYRDKWSKTSIDPTPAKGENALIKNARLVERIAMAIINNKLYSNAYQQLPVRDCKISSLIRMQKGGFFNGRKKEGRYWRLHCTAVLDRVFLGHFFFGGQLDGDLGLQCSGGKIW